MASKGEVGLDIDVSRVPLREADMEPFEVMISESQERMLCVVEPERLEDVLALCGRWDVRSTVIGEVTDTQRLRVFDADELVGDMPVDALVDDVPLYDLDPEEPSEPVYAPPPARLAADATADETLLALLRSPNIASKRFVFEQYDPIVGSRTMRRPQSADAAVLILEPDGGSGALAVSIDGNGRRVACDPYTGAAEAVLECARNLAAVGAEPLGLTNCLNFGNPEKPHIAWQLTRSVEGLRDACLALGVPVVGGNVSLYNEGGGGPIYPTPIVGMVGKLPEPEAVPRTAFAEEGHAIALVGMFEPALEGSELEKLRGSLARSLPPLDLAAHAEALVAVRSSVRVGPLPTAHDVSDGGLACALAECCIEGGVGARVSIGTDDVALFGEGPGGVIVAGPRQAIEAIATTARALIIGEVGGDSLEIDGALSVPVADLREAYEGAIPAAFAA
jgi:phosphoribosylformylglycinamidine synthase